LSMEWLGFGCEKLMYASPLLLWSTARSGTILVTPWLCMCWWACTSPCELLALCMVGTCVLWISSACLMLSFYFHILANLPSGFAAWHNVFSIFVFVFVGNNEVIKDV
jgi:hypothetical protein